MSKFINISDIPTDVLTELRSMLKYGVKATASKAGDEARKLREANATLKKTAKRKDAVLEAGLEWFGSEDYFMSFSDKNFVITVEKLSHTMKTAEAQVKPNMMRIPQLSRSEEVSGIEGVKQFLVERRNK